MSFAEISDYEYLMEEPVSPNTIRKSRFLVARNNHPHLGNYPISPQKKKKTLFYERNQPKFSSLFFSQNLVKSAVFDQNLKI